MGSSTVESVVNKPMFPDSPSFRAIIPRMTFDPPEGKALFFRVGQRSYVDLLCL